jgi:hypothetical protein
LDDAAAITAEHEHCKFEETYPFLKTGSKPIFNSKGFLEICTNGQNVYLSATRTGFFSLVAGSNASGHFVTRRFNISIPSTIFMSTGGSGCFGTALKLLVLGILSFETVWSEATARVLVVAVDGEGAAGCAVAACPAVGIGTDAVGGGGATSFFTRFLLRFVLTLDSELSKFSTASIMSSTVRLIFRFDPAKPVGGSAWPFRVLTPTPLFSALSTPASVCIVVSLFNYDTDTTVKITTFKPFM